MQPPVPPLSPPVAHPIKKQRAGRSPNAAEQFSARADGAIARRREELERLRASARKGAAANNQTTTPVAGQTSTDALLARARSELDASHRATAAPPPTRSSARPPMRGGGRPGPPPIPSGITAPERRTSDIFPHVQKVPSPYQKPRPTISRSDVSSSPTPPPQGGPPTVARRLDPSFRSKSAPPSRPPPPPVAPPVEAPESRRPPAPAPGPPPKGVGPPPKPGKEAAPPSIPPKKKPPPKGPAPSSSSRSAPTPPPSPGGPKKTVPITAPAPPPSSKKTSSAAPEDSTTATKSASHTPFPTKGAPPSHETPMAAKPASSDAGHTPFPAKGLPETPELSEVAETPFIPGQASETPESSEMDTKQPPIITDKAGHTPFISAKGFQPSETPGSDMAAEPKGYAPPIIETPELEMSSKLPSSTDNTAVQTPFISTMKGPPPTSGGTPEESLSTQTSTTSRPRRDQLRSMRKYVDTPPSLKKEEQQGGGGSIGQSLELRLQKELAQTEKDKTEALRKIAKLEDEISQMKQQQQGSPGLHAVLQLADSEGEQSAIQWARQQVVVGSDGGDKIGFLSPMAAAVSPTRGGGSLTTPPSSRRRASLPRPKRQQQDLDPTLLKQAAERVEHEYVTDLATYTIRRPYGLAEEREMWMAAGQLVTKKYERGANVTKPDTLEVSAQIEADGTLLAVYDEAVARHQNTNGNWDEYGNVFEREEPLGTFLYIDSEANEQEYSLDDVFEGAIAVREYYCSSVLSTAAGLKVDNKNSSKPAGPGPMVPPTHMIPGMQAVSKKKVETSEIGVGTEDLPQPAAAPAQEPTKELDNAKALPDDASTDVFAALMDMFFSGIVSLLWNVFVRFPLQVVSFTLALAISVFLLSLAWLYMADDHGAAAMGASMDFMYNRPGIM